MWHLGLIGNNITYSLARMNFSKDINIILLTDNSEHETYYLVSPHFSYLSEEEYEKAYYKALSFVRLINGCLLLEGDSLLAPNNYLTYFNSTYTSIRSGAEVCSKSFLEYDQLVNPYEDLHIEDLESKSYLANCMTLVKNDVKVRRVIGLLYLYNRDNLYLLVNAYKIYEIICADLAIERKEKAYKKVRDSLNANLTAYLDYFILGNFTHYANTLESSNGNEVAGILSRHGQSKEVYDKQPLDPNELDFKLRNLINVWLSEKIERRLRISYKENKYISRHVSKNLMNDTFIFD